MKKLLFAPFVFVAVLWVLSGSWSRDPKLLEASDPYVDLPRCSDSPIYVKSLEEKTMHVYYKGMQIKELAMNEEATFDLEHCSK